MRTQYAKLTIADAAQKWTAVSIPRVAVTRPSMERNEYELLYFGDPSEFEREKDLSLSKEEPLYSLFADAPVLQARHFFTQDVTQNMLDNVFASGGKPTKLETFGFFEADIKDKLFSVQGDLIRNKYESRLKDDFGSSFNCRCRFCCSISFFFRFRKSSA